MIKTYICLEEFQKFIMNYVQSNSLEDAFKATIFFDDEKSKLCFQAMQHGIIWAGLLAAAEKEIQKYYLN